MLTAASVWRSRTPPRCADASCWAEDKWLGISELVHPVARFHFPVGISPVSDPRYAHAIPWRGRLPAHDLCPIPRRQDPRGAVESSWGADIFVDPSFRGGFFDGLESSYARGGAMQATPGQSESALESGSASLRVHCAIGSRRSCMTHWLCLRRHGAGVPSAGGLRDGLDAGGGLGGILHLLHALRTRPAAD